MSNIDKHPNYGSFTIKTAQTNENLWDDGGSDWKGGEIIANPDMDEFEKIQALWELDPVEEKELPTSYKIASVWLIGFFLFVIGFCTTVAIKHIL